MRNYLQIDSVVEGFANVDVMHTSVVEFIPNDTVSFNSIRFVARLLPDCGELVAVIVAVVAVQSVVGPDARVAVDAICAVICRTSERFLMHLEGPQGKKEELQPSKLVRKEWLDVERLQGNNFQGCRRRPYQSSWRKLVAESVDFGVFC
jgi:hypothetical protein